MSIKAGQLRHRIDIEERTASQDATTGETTYTWVLLHKNVPAAIEPLSVREFVAARAGQSEITVRVVIRYREGLDASMRIIHNSKVYNPQGWLPDMDSGIEYLTAPCSEGVNEGG
jgi:SPP1 family predicted phage head-tail adaptor